MTSIFDFLLTSASAYLTGLLLNLTPCVYPMISITVALFRSQTRQSGTSPLAHALIYVGGLAAFYSLLGLVSSLGIFFFGGYFQSPWVLTLLSGMMFLLALSMFGLFSLRLPGWILSRAQGSSSNRGRFAGLFLSGFVVGIFAAPCIGPPIVALMSLVAMKGEPVFAMWLFFVLAIGLGTPYLILGAFSGAIEKLPRAGQWLVWIEHLFGAILFSLSGLYLILAWAPFLEPFWLPFALVAGGIYMGFFEKPGMVQPSFETIRKAISFLAMAAGILVFSLIFRERVTWEAYSPEKIEAAGRQGQMTMIDFYADWCLVCHELDNLTFTNSEVIKALEPFRRLKVDMTDPDAPASMQAALRYRIFGVPTVIFVDPHGNEVEKARIEGFVSPKELIAVIRSLASSPSGRLIDESASSVS